MEYDVAFPSCRGSFHTTSFEEKSSKYLKPGRVPESEGGQIYLHFVTVL